MAYAVPPKGRSVEFLWYLLDMGESSAISAVGLGFSYRRAVLTDLNVDLPEGTLLALVGENGAGKTTALSLFAGERPPDAGRIRLFGKDPFRREGRGLAYLLKEWPTVVGYLLPEEAVGFYGRLYGHRWSRFEREAFLDRCGLSGKARTKVKSFSKGMVRRLELACLLAADPPIWLLDEPQTGLDPAGVQLLYELLLEAKQRNRTIVWCTHLLQDLERLADHVLALSSGLTVWQGSLDALRSETRSKLFIVSGDRTQDESSAPIWPASLSGVEGPFLNPAELSVKLFPKSRGHS
ncbi:MAG TPA: ABC transporter ATP-binding protein [Planctomycetota bacterium]|nr:ABC transporter ATP-binding protein [Planctomycetota bacterium]